jgi:hypothetical protein
MNCPATLLIVDSDAAAPRLITCSFLDVGGISSTPPGLVTASTRGQFIAQVRWQLTDPALLAPRLRQDTAELDQVGVGEVVQVHPHHRFGNRQHPREEIGDNDQDVILGGTASLRANMTKDKHAVPGRRLYTDEMLVSLEAAKDALSKGDRSVGVAAGHAAAHRL